MTYCTQADLIRLFGQQEIQTLSQLDYPANGTIDSDRVAAACEYATQEIDSYIGMRYTLPLASVPVVLVNKAADIARYQLEHDAPREDVRKRYEDAVAWLKLIAAGKAGLGVDPGTGEEVAATDLRVDYLIPDTVFSDTALRGY